MHSHVSGVRTGLCRCQSYDNIADNFYEKREWYIEQAFIDEAITQLPASKKI